MFRVVRSEVALEDKQPQSAKCTAHSAAANSSWFSAPSRYIHNTLHSEGSNGRVNQKLQRKTWKTGKANCGLQLFSMNIWPHFPIQPAENHISTSLARTRVTASLGALRAQISIYDGTKAMHCRVQVHCSITPLHRGLSGLPCWSSFQSHSPTFLCVSLRTVFLRINFPTFEAHLS